MSKDKTGLLNCFLAKKLHNYFPFVQHNKALSKYQNKISGEMSFKVSPEKSEV